MKHNYVSIGKILNFHGVRGEAKFGYTKNREDFLAKLEGVYLLFNDDYKYFEIEKKNDDNLRAGNLERFAFYERAKKAYAIIATGEGAVYANIIIKKGVIK